MKIPPIYHKPAEWDPLNGQLPDAAHVAQVDAIATWLVTRRPPIPPSIGAAMNNATYTEIVHVPAYVEHIGFRFLAAGSGDLDVSCSDDTYDARVEVSGGGNARTDASIYQLITPLSSVTSSTLNRALDVDDQSSPHRITVTFTVPSSVWVWEAVPFFLARNGTTLLPL